jgi:hypothetical protein
MELATSLDLDVWSHSVHGVQLRVTPEQKWQLQHLTRNKILINVVVDNIQDAIDTELVQLMSQPSFQQFTNETWHTAYHPYTDVVSWLAQLEQTYQPIVSFIPSIGKTSQGRDIPMLKITGKPGHKKVVFYQGLQHAREWIGLAALQYMAHHLAQLYVEGDGRVVSLLDAIEIHLVPISNPDGYDYAWTRERLWRKNRAPPFGTDINRNWPFHWCEKGASKFPASDTYCGPSAGSELEVQALMRAFTKAANSSDIILAADFHAFSQLILRPYGCTDKPCEDEDEFVKLGQVIKQAMAKRANRSYTSIPITSLYPASGGSNDWWYGAGTPVGRIKPLGIALELPPKNGGAEGFILPPKEIIPVGVEVLEAVLSMCEYALKHPLGIRH